MVYRFRIQPLMGQTTVRYCVQMIFPNPVSGFQKKFLKKIARILQNLHCRSKISAWLTLLTCWAVSSNLAVESRARAFIAMATAAQARAITACTQSAR
jgi:hypothetical protein